LSQSTQPPLKHGSCFTGIGGLDLGFERAGIETRWQIENDRFCRKLLAVHFPNALRYGNIKHVRPEDLEPVDIVSGGFPCQDVSNAGYRVGMAGARSGLWSELYRLVCHLRPRILVVENVTGLLVRGLGRVLGDLAAIGYDAEWDCFSAAEFGAPHRRTRVFVIAYPHRDRLETNTHESVLRQPTTDREANGHPRTMGSAGQWLESRPPGARPMGVGNGVPEDVDRLKALGNAVVPQVSEWIGQKIVQYFA
jgi:DNA (cytosine-5)-methyltransferase 1